MGQNRYQCWGARGVSSSGCLPALGEAVGLPRSGASSSVDSHRAEVGSREVRSLRQSVSKFSGKLQEFSLWIEHFEAMVRSMASFLTDYDVMIGDVSKDAQYFLSQGFSEEHIKTARIA